MKTMKLLLGIGILTLSPTILFGQFTETLKSDRPGQTMSPNTVGKKALQFQFGYTFSDFDEVNRNLQYYNNDARNMNDRIENGINLKTRYGILEKTELSIELTSNHIANSFKRTSSVSDENEEYESIENDYFVGLGVRQNFISNEEAGFNLGAELQANYEYSDSKGENVDGYLNLAASKQLAEKLSIAGNGGLTFYNLDFYFTCNLGYSVTDKVGIYAEYYPYFSDDTPLANKKNLRMTHSYVNTGLSYLISPNFMLDLTGGFLVSDYDRGENTDISNYNIQIGLTSRLDWR